MAKFTDDELHDFYEEWEFNEADPGRIEFFNLVREVERRIAARCAPVARADLAELQLGLGQVAFAVREDPVKLKCCARVLAILATMPAGVREDGNA